MSAWLNRNLDKKVGVIWIDAHADLHSVYTTPPDNINGMPLGCITKSDNIDNQITPINQEIATYWNKLKNLSTQSLIFENLFFLGLRSFEKPEQYLINKNNVFNLSAKQHQEIGIDQGIDLIINKISQLDSVYISFDINSLDKSLVPATGTPVSNGYQVDQINQKY